jgi:uncharacterized protein
VTDNVEGASTPAFLASFGKMVHLFWQFNLANLHTLAAFFVVFTGVLGFVYLICPLRTNVTFVAVFVTVVASFGQLAGSYWQAANGAYNLAHNLQFVSVDQPFGDSQVILIVFKAGGASLFVCCLCAWYIFIAQMLAALDFPFQIPIGDLNTMIKGASQKGL